MKHSFTLETSVEDSAGFEYIVTAEVKAETYYDKEEGGLFVEEVNISDVEIKRDGETIKLKYVEDMPDKFNQDQVRYIYEHAEEKVILDVYYQSEARYEHRNN